jgi:hypothetical protein
MRGVQPVIVEVIVDDRRKLMRHRVFKFGRIGFNRAAGIDCRVRNLSPSGACLEVASQVGIPEDFTLVITHDYMQQPCHVVRRDANRMGVEFRAA